MRAFLRIAAGVVVGILATIGFAIVLVTAIGVFALKTACVGDQCTAQAWAAALGGWVATIVAVATIFVLHSTLQHMRKSSEKQLRAYVYQVNAWIKGIDGDEPRVYLVVKNFGQTPAYRVLVTQQSVIGPATMQEKSDAPKFSKNMGDMAPGQDNTLEFFLDKGELERVKDGLISGHDRLFFIVVIRYEAFKMVRRTYFRLHNAEGRPFGDGPLVVSGDGIRSD